VATAFLMLSMLLVTLPENCLARLILILVALTTSTWALAGSITSR